MDKKEYMKIWREKNRERLLAYSRERYQTVRKFEIRKSRRKDPETKCFLCSILLDSKLGGKGRRLYCTSCAENTAKLRYNLYHRRAYQKRIGIQPEKIVWRNIKV